MGPFANALITLASLATPMVANGQGGSPPSPNRPAPVVGAPRYQGTTAVPHRTLNPEDRQLRLACELLSRADIIPADRKASFSGLPTRYTVVGWRLTVHRLEQKDDGLLVHVWVAPLLKATGGGIPGVMSFYRETYRIAGGKVKLVGGDPVSATPPIMMGGEQ